MAVGRLSAQALESQSAPLLSAGGNYHPEKPVVKSPGNVDQFLRAGYGFERGDLNCAVEMHIVIADNGANDLKMVAFSLGG